MKKIAYGILIAAAAGCNNANDNAMQTKDSAGNESLTLINDNYGTADGQQIKEYTIRNADGMAVSIINYGGTVTRLLAPDRNHVQGDVVLGYTSLEGFLQKGNPYFNSLIGRYGNRIAKGSFTLDGKQYTLAGNNNGNSLHGGNKGFDKVVWNVKGATDSSVTLGYLSKDGEEGYPGNLDITVTYTLTSNNELKIDYTATTDKATPVNLTSHCYFNLSAGRDSTILNHQLELNAGHYTPVNAQLIPTGQVAPVKGTPMDFTSPKRIGQDIGQVPGGYDHNWVLIKTGNDLTRAAALYDSASGRYMEVLTTEPAIQFYSGNFLDGTLAHTKDGKKYVQHAALCLETQHYPDSPNQPSFPNTILKPGETYRHTTVYKFSVK